MRSTILVFVTVLSLVWSVGTVSAASAQDECRCRTAEISGRLVMISAEMDGKKVVMQT